MVTIDEFASFSMTVWPATLTVARTSRARFSVACSFHLATVPGALAALKTRYSRYFGEQDLRAAFCNRRRRRARGLRAASIMMVLVAVTWAKVLPLLFDCPSALPHPHACAQSCCGYSVYVVPVARSALSVPTQRRRVDRLSRATAPSRRRPPCGWRSRPRTCSGSATQRAPRPGRQRVRPGVSVDPEPRTAEVGGMTTYEDLVAPRCRTA